MDFTAVKEDEISMLKGEVVQLVSANQHNRYLVFRPANENSPAAEGWVPGHVIGQKDGDNGFRSVLMS